jgi:glutamate--cysteine ligase
VSEISEFDQEYRKFRTEIDPILTEFELEMMTVGYHPTTMARDIPLLPKSRYKYMDAHFAHSGAHGICMMRASASTQVSIDFFSIDDAVRKFRVSNLLSPLLAFVTDNSPVFEGEPIAMLGNTKSKTRSGLTVPDRMVRTIIWDDVDEDRAKTMPQAFDSDFDFRSYAEALLDSPAIFAFETSGEAPGGGTGNNSAHQDEGDHGNNHTPDSSTTRGEGYLGSQTFGEFLANKPLDIPTIEHILSLFFYDVRLKTYVEIRAADSLPIEYALAYSALIKGIFYNESALLTLSQSLEGFDATDIADAKEALRYDGFDAIVYGRSAEQWLDELMFIANDFLSESERIYLEPLAKAVAQRKTPLEIIG